jgi:hypothetical protein
VLVAAFGVIGGPAVVLLGYAKLGAVTLPARAAVVIIAADRR